MTTSCNESSSMTKPYHGIFQSSLKSTLTDSSEARMALFTTGFIRKLSLSCEVPIEIESALLSWSVDHDYIMDANITDQEYSTRVFEIKMDPLIAKHLIPFV